MQRAFRHDIILKNYNHRYEKQEEIMKIGFLYAGQGAQHVGMGKDLYEAYPEFREVFDNVKLDFDVKECCFDGPIEKLGQTR